MGKILIVEDSKAIREIITLHLEGDGHKVIAAKDGVQGLELIQLEQPDLVILDIMMPEMDGYEVCKKIRADQESKDTYVLFLSAKNKVEDRITGLDIGADAYLTKPFDADELKAHIRVGLRTKKMKTNTLIDSLTGLNNRRSFSDILKRETYQKKTGDTPYCLVKMDIDDFKVKVSHYGIKWGEKVLISLANLLKELGAPGDIAIRWSNKSFIWLFPNTELERALKWTEQLRERVDAVSFLEVGDVTLSIGIAEGDANENSQKICHRVEKALESAVESGKNKVEVSYIF